MRQGRNQGGKCRCEGCDAMFNGMRAFDWHRVGAFKMHGHTRRCLSVAEMQTKGMVRTAAGIWTTGREFAGIDKVSA